MAYWGNLKKESRPLVPSWDCGAWNDRPQPSLENRQFDNGRTYGQVADALRKGTFTPDKQLPELLPEQLVYDGDDLKPVRAQYPHLPFTFTCGDWGSPDYYEI